MLSIVATPEWRADHPGAVIGLLEVSGVDNTSLSPGLDERKRQTESALRERYRGFTRQALLALPVMAAYARYYRRFGKTYHVQLQLESIVLRDKRLPDVSSLVDANFIAEMDTLVLTAGHDVARLRAPVSMDVAKDGDGLTQMTGASRAVPAGDMIMRDAEGVCCSIIYGQDGRSPISRETSHALYVAYAPAAVSFEIVEGHLQRVEEHVRLVSPSAVRQQLRLLQA